MNEANFVKRVGYLAAGDGFRVCDPLNILSDVKGAAGLVLDTSTTTPTIEALETGFYGLQAAASTTHLGLFDWTVPDDYDDAADELRIRVLCNMAAADATDLAASKITPSIYRKRAETAVTLDLGAPATAAAAIPSSTVGAKWIEINADARKTTIDGSLDGAANRSLAATANASIKPGDALCVVLTAAAHTTDAINIYGIEIWYRSNLAFTTIENR